ncbi:hypothetical protein LCGC14_0744620 [marine sediment metagenome]|uniref:Uncharacterized protein n=1 Tax=marine sediment metagenome TaxID=412755 RepID=A0A0F9Q5S0_9ZZZZ|nr:hypothetical protein [bacterium]
MGGIEEKNKSPISKSTITLFRFELNHSQASLFLILSLTGIFMLPYLLAGDIFLNLFQHIFYTIPRYMENPGVYVEDYLFRSLFPIVLSIIQSVIFLSMSVYVFRRILKNRTNKNGPRRKTISQKRTVNWLGLKISHGQSLFIFCTSLAGLFFLLQLSWNSSSYGYGPSWGGLKSLTIIPTGPNQGIGGDGTLSNNVTTAIISIFVILCLYSLFITRRGKPITPSTNITKNYSILIFIGSFVVFVMLSARIFFHLSIFNYEISRLLGTYYIASNSYQNNDFIKTLVLFCICLALMISSFYLKERNHNDMKPFNEFSWFRIKLTPHRVTILISSALICLTFFSYLYLTFTFMFGDFSFLTPFFYNIYHLILFPVIIFCCYPIFKILANNRFEKALEYINNSQEFRIKWFKTRLDKKNSVIFLSVSSTVVVLNIFQLLLTNMGAQAFYSSVGPLEPYMLLSYPLMTIIILLVIVVNIYTIIKTFPSIKDSKSQNLKNVDNGNKRN